MILLLTILLLSTVTFWTLISSVFPALLLFSTRSNPAPVAPWSSQRQFLRTNQARSRKRKPKGSRMQSSPKGKARGNAPSLTLQQTREQGWLTAGLRARRHRPMLQGHSRKGQSYLNLLGFYSILMQDSNLLSI